MPLKIRLARGGAKKRPFYSIVIADSRSPRDGRFIEKIGTYNPMLSKDDANRIRIDQDRAKHWLSQGAQPTDRVALFFGNAGRMEKPKWRDTPNKSAPKAKAQERAKASSAAAAAAEAWRQLPKRARLRSCGRRLTPARPCRRSMGCDARLRRTNPGSARRPGIGLLASFLPPSSRPSPVTRL